MKTLRLTVLFLINLFCCGSFAFSQTDNSLTCLALVKRDSVVLRWVPNSIPVWQTGNKYGYVIKRYTIARDGAFIPDGLSNAEMLTPNPLKPYSNDEFEILTLSEPNSAIVRDAIFGNEFQSPTESNNFIGFMKGYNDLEVRFGFALFACDLSPKIARAAGLRFTDRNVLPNERYAYSISLANIPDGMEVEPAVVVLDAGLLTNLPVINDVEAIFLDREVKLRWPILLFKGIFTAYILEKSVDGTSFAPVSGLPLVNLTEKDNPVYFVYTDSLINNDIQIWYRVKGISPFGETGPVSDLIKGKGTPEFTAYAVIDSAEVIENNKIVIRWRVSERESAPVTGISVLRSGTPDGVFESLSGKPLPSNARMYSDVRPRLSNYYKILLVGRNNLKSLSFPYLVQTVDNDPPSAPQMLTGKVDSSGIVTIAWKKNSESDLLGYKVFVANSPDEEFVSLSHEISKQNVCHDTISLNTLTQKICYRVVAFDKTYNGSEYSEILQLTRPDTICPAPAVITRIDVFDGNVIIHLEKSPANDIKSYELQRITENDTIFIVLKSWKDNLPESFNDASAGPGRNYYYLLKTIDFTGNVSGNKRNVYVPDTSPKTIKLSAKYGVSGRSVLLMWDMPAGFQPAKTIIYRGKEKEPVTILITLEGVDQVFEDNDIEMDLTYTYRMKVMCKGSNAIVTSGQISVSPVLNKTSEIKQN
jgi:hypothetical protein